MFLLDSAEKRLVKKFCDADWVKVCDRMKCKRTGFGWDIHRGPYVRMVRIYSECGVDCCVAFFIGGCVVLVLGIPEIWKTLKF